MKYSVLLITFLILFGSTSAEMRYWRQSDGTVFEGEYLRQKLGNAYFEGPDRKTVSIAIEDLVPSDKKFLESMVPPEVAIQVRTKDIPEEGIYRDPKKSVLKATVTLTKKGKKVFNGTLTTEVYLIREEVADLHRGFYRILTKKTAQVRFPEGRKSPAEIEVSGIVRTFDIKGEFRGWAYAGFLVVVLDRNGEVLQTKSDLGWLDDENLKALRKMELWKFFDEDCRRKSTPRPRYFDNRTM